MNDIKRYRQRVAQVKRLSVCISILMVMFEVLFYRSLKSATVSFLSSYLLGVSHFLVSLQVIFIT